MVPTSLFACNLTAISAAERPRYNQLIKQIREAIQGRIELSDGYRFRLDSKVVTLSETAEWISMERMCCPFLTFQLGASGDQPDWTLTITGQTGVNSLLDDVFPAR
jgi:hypothetical protein